MNKAHQNHVVVLSQMAKLSQTEVAARMGVSSPTVSRIKDERLQQVCELIAAADCVIVPADAPVSADEQELRWLKDSLLKAQRENDRLRAQLAELEAHQ